MFGGVAAVVAVAIIVAVTVSSGGSDENQTTANGGTSPSHEIGQVEVAGEALPTYVKATTDPAVGSAVPALSGISVLDGSKMQIKPGDKPMVIAFLAHWCPHCQRELPLLVSAAKTGALDGIDVYAVATGTDADYPNYPPSAWLEREHWPFPAMADTRQFVAARAFGLPSYPYLVFVDARGKVAGRISGELAREDLVSIFTALAAGKRLPGVVSGAASKS